ncbi:Hpt domain-containing protein [Pseudaestuariivita sp.]|uniref:Hpt domain-containing protein n=1 Tax=Pseudaestuariivita sp. TaxID=2211669 RepID=UPI004057E74E
MIDWDQVAELREAVGADEFDDLIEVFLDEVETVLNEITASPDDAQLESRLHFVKGSALNLGFTQFAALCQTGESTARAGTPGDVDLAQIMDAYAAEKDELMREMGVKFAA